jgi:hypothetical protein
MVVSNRSGRRYPQLPVAALLLRQCREARLDVSESDEAWIEGLLDGSNGISIKRKHVGRLLKCARQLHIIEEEFA